MGRTINIDPVTRIEGHSKITLQLDDTGEVSTARFHVTQFRGFEKLCEGRPFSEMPSLTARTCGICPVSHLIASSKACDALLAVHIPRTAKLLRRIINHAQIIQSHALSFFYLSSPDLLLGMDAPVEKRSLFGVLQSNPQLGRDGIRIRSIGQQIIETLGGKRIHPAWVVPGGVNDPLTNDKRTLLAGLLPNALEIARRTLDTFKQTFKNFRDEIQNFGNFPSMFMAMVTPDGGLETYDGLIRIIDSDGAIVADKLDPQRYFDYIGEAIEPDTFLKSPFYKPRVDSFETRNSGMYRVGPLARLNACTHTGTPLADLELAEFKKLSRGPVLSSFHFHYARLIEILFCVERCGELLNDPDILSTRVRAHAGVNCLEGVGASEAPRGTLFHHYKIDEQGLMRGCNLIIATGHNSLAMNAAILQTARRYVHGDTISDGMLNRVEAVIRCYDPCLSCSTHAMGQMPLQIILKDAGGNVLTEVQRD